MTKPRTFHPMWLLAVILAGLCRAPFPAGAAAPLSFAGPRNFGAGSNPYSVAVADLNGDGKPDLAVANRYSDNVSVLLNTTNPITATLSFAWRTNFDVGEHPYTVVAADLNGDGRPDLAVGNRYSDSVSVLLNTTSPGAATPTFARTDFAAGDDSGSVVVADLNGDGMPDLATANLEGNNVSVLLNTTSPGAATPSFAGAVNFAAGNGSSSIAAVDLNGDGMLDLAVGNRNNNTVSVLLNITSPGAATPSFAGARNFAVGRHPFSIAAADLNGDGRPDLATANYDSANASVLLNTTSPGAATPSFASAVNFAAGSEPGSVAAADLNGDGRPDLAVANYESNTVSALLNTTRLGAATPDFAGAVNFAAADGSGSVAVADLNCDGRPDLATANYNVDSATVLLNTAVVGAAPPSFAGPANFVTGSNPYSVAAADLNGDGKPDLAVTNYGSNNVSVLLNTASPGATTPSFADPPANFAAGAGPISVAAADLNGDGKPDLAVTNKTSNNVSVLLNTTSPGAAAPSFAGPATFGTSDAPAIVTAADLNGDGRPDLIVANLVGNNVSVLLNTTSPGAATPSFASAAYFGAGSSPYSVTVADLNGDGKPDLAVANGDGDNVSVLLNTTSPGATTPSFADAVNFAAGDSPASVAAADLNSDGRPDLVVANYDSNNVSVLLNTTSPGAATPSFASAVNFAAGDSPASVAAADLNGDGKPDLAVANYGSNNDSVLLNTTSPGAATPSFAGAVNLGAGSNPQSVVAADLNGDGRPDLATANQSSNNVSVWLNTTEAYLTLTKNVTPAALPVAPGQAITYTLAFTNPNLFTATGVMVTDTIPVSVTGVSVASNVAITDTGAVPAYAWQVADLAPGASGVITITGVLSSPLSAGVFTNTATIAAPAIISREAQVGLEVPCKAAVTVSSVADSGAGSLRQAIADVCSGGTIDFAAGLAGQTITLTSAELTIAKTVTLTNFHAPGLQLSGNNARRIFSIQATGVVTLSHLSIISGTASNGGGIINEGTLSVVNSTLSGNSVSHWGGGIYNYGGTLSVVNSTLSGNSADYGGGIYNLGTLSVANSTLSGNEAGYTGGGGIRNRGTLNLTNTIIANSLSGDCRNSDGLIPTKDHNLIEGKGDDACGITNGEGSSIIGLDPLLAPLGDYGGATQTVALLPGSPAIDAGANCLATDQRGIARPQGSSCDIGAFESQGFTFTNLTGTPQSAPINTAFANPLALTVTANGTGEIVAGGVISFTAPTSGPSIAEVTPFTKAIGADGTVSASVTANGTSGGPYAVTAHASGATSVNFALTNDQGVASVTLGNLNQTYDGAPKPVSVSTTPSGLAASVTYAGSPTAPTNVGAYSVIASVNDPNYQGTATGTLTITARPITVTADAQSKVYGAPDPALTYQVTGGSLVAGDSLTGTLTRAAGEAVGMHAIQQGTLTADSNYALSFVGADLTILPVDTTLALSSSLNPATVGDLITFTAQVAAVGPGAGLPSGVVTFTLDGAQIVRTLNALGAATYSTGTLDVGVHPLSAAYGGDVNFNPSSQTLVGGQVITDTDIAQLALTSSSPTTLGQTTWFTATAWGSHIVYTWDWGDGLTEAPIPSLATASHVYGAAGVYTVHVTATNGVSQVVASTLVTITNLTPVANAGADQTVLLSTAVTLDGSGSTDPDGHLPLAFGWMQTSGTPVVLSSSTISRPTFTAPASPTVLRFSLVVTDAHGLRSAVASTAAITVSDTAIVGLSAANSGPNPVGSPTVLTAKASGDHIVYTWDLGDGSLATGDRITHTYGRAGNYTAIVTASNSSNVVTATTSVAIDPMRICLPLVMRTYVVAPDLVVQRIVATNNNVQVVIQNQGDTPVVDEFWVDVYIAPTTAPTQVNQTWPHLGAQGLVWGVTSSALPALTPGGVLTLTVGDAYYYPDLSQVAWPLEAGTPTYVQVDSANADTTYGAVLENHEIIGGPYNNLSQAVSTVASNEAVAQPVVDGSPSGVVAHHLPRRP